MPSHYVLQINCDGVPYAPEEAPFVWIPPDITSDSNKLKSKILAIDLCPQVKLPLEDTSLVSLIDLLEKCQKHNFIATLLALGAGIQTFHYESIIKLFGGCPITVLTGPPETGKTKTILAVHALFGSSESSYYVKGTNTFFLDRSAESTLPYGIDDPQMQATSGRSKSNFIDLQELIVDLYNGAKTANAVKGSRKPRSAPIVATNFDLVRNHRYVSQC